MTTTTRDAAWYANQYRRRPPLAARRIVWVRAQAQRARQDAAAADAAGQADIAAGFRHDADQYEDLAAQLEAALDQLVCCRRCGRGLRHPASVAAGVGPECIKKTET